MVSRTKKPKIKVDRELGKTTKVSLRKNSSANLRRHSKTPMVECKKENSDAEIPHEKQAGIKPEVIRSDQPISNEKVTLQWINEKLRTNYCTLNELRDGKGLIKLVENILGFIVRSKMWWEELGDILLMPDMETEIELAELKRCNGDALWKMIKWLRDEEKISR